MTTPIAVSAIHHVGIPVADLDRSLAFYTEVLGLKKIAQPKQWQHVRWLRIGGQHVHLQKAEMGTLGPDGPRHFALQVNDIAAARKFLEAKGYTIDPQPPIRGAERFYIKDPDGNSVELIQWFEEYGDGRE
jgi:glyoxylase I family protein